LINKEITNTKTEIKSKEFKNKRIDLTLLLQ